MDRWSTISFSQPMTSFVEWAWILQKFPPARTGLTKSGTIITGPAPKKTGSIWRGSATVNSSDIPASIKFSGAKKPRSTCISGTTAEKKWRRCGVLSPIGQFLFQRTRPEKALLRTVCGESRPKQGVVQAWIHSGEDIPDHSRKDLLRTNRESLGASQASVQRFSLTAATRSNQFQF